MSDLLTIWRIASQGSTWMANDLSGNGAALNPGRWNSTNSHILYSSSSIALACLETLVHLAGDDPLPLQRQLVRISLPRQHWEQRTIFYVNEHSSWALPPTPETVEDWLTTTRAWGDAWLRSLKSLIAEVPSVIVPEESNLLLNPRHPGRRDVVAEVVRPWVYDARLQPAARTAIPKAGPPWQQLLQGGVGLEMVPIPAGQFLMGSPEDEPGRSPYEGPRRRVRVAPFSLARTPITQAQWREVALWRPEPGEPAWEQSLTPYPSKFGDRKDDSDERPVENVSWINAMEFCRRLSRKTRKHFTLPSEAQWEYACRANTSMAYSFGHTFDQSHANIRMNETTAVASFPANTWGLHDMHGNVWEWCADHWHENYSGAPDNGKSWIDPKADDYMNRVVRGGSWKEKNPNMCRAAIRDYWQPDYYNDNIGFRVCCLNSITYN
jgi:formylglycine-generating enzyme required for sulfatase activity